MGVVEDLELIEDVAAVIEGGVWKLDEFVMVECLGRMEVPGWSSKYGGVGRAGNPFEVRVHRIS